MSANHPLEAFLASLDPDRNRAGERYEILRHKLLKFFGWREHPDAVILVDETIDRAARLVDGGVKPISPDAFCLGIARKVRSEHLRSPVSRHVSLDVADAPADPAATPLAALERDEADRQAAREYRRMTRRFQRLPQHVRTLLTEYYRGSGRERSDRRAALAAAQQINLNQLRIKVCRVRRSLAARGTTSKRIARVK
jgi:hypothetical protein